MEDKSLWQQPGALQRRLSHGGHQPQELHPSQPHNELFTGLGCLWEEPRRAEEEERKWVGFWEIERSWGKIVRNRERMR